MANANDVPISLGFSLRRFLPKACKTNILSQRGSACPREWVAGRLPNLRIDRPGLSYRQVTAGSFSPLPGGRSILSWPQITGPPACGP